MDAVTSIVPEIKQRFDLKICACLGLLTPEQAERLKACGVDRVNHNVNTSSEFYEQICQTHTYQDRLDTLQAVRQAGLELCSGGIIGMGESKADIWCGWPSNLRELQVESIPLNFLNPIDGTPLAGLNRINAARLPQDVGDVPLCQSRQGIAHRRWPRTPPAEVCSVWDCTPRIPSLWATT